MITLLHHPDGPIQNRVKVLLCVTPEALDDPDESLVVLFDEAQTTGRKVGCIVRHFGGNSYFTFAPSQQQQLEISLLAALATPTAEMHVTHDSGRNHKW